MARPDTTFFSVLALVFLFAASCGGTPKSAKTPAPDVEAHGYWVKCAKPADNNENDCVALRGLGDEPITTTEPISMACAAGDVDACKIRGKLLVTRDLEAEAGSHFDFIEMACNHNEPNSCEALGEIFVNDEEVEAAHAAFRRGCEYGSTSSCLQLGQLIRLGAGCDRNRKLAVRLFEQTCLRGESRGCTLAADMYRQGWGVAFSPTRAADLYQQACNTDNPRACRKLSELYRSGNGVAKSDDEANDLLGRACAMGSSNACDELRRHKEKNRPGANPTGLHEVAAPSR